MSTTVLDKPHVVTSPSGLSAEEFYERYHDRRAELVKGEVTEMTPAGADHGVVAMNSGTDLNVHVRRNKLGIVCAAETGFIVARDPTTVRAPDAAFISNERLAQLEDGRPTRGFWPFAPDLAVEVMSPGDSAEEIEIKVREWFDGGALLVWVLYPSSRTVHVHWTRERVQILEGDAVLDGGEVVPGFSCSIKEFFVSNTITDKR